MLGNEQKVLKFKEKLEGKTKIVILNVSVESSSKQFLSNFWMQIKISTNYIATLQHYWLILTELIDSHAFIKSVKC